MFKELVEKLLAEGLEEREDLFLIDLTISNDNNIKVIIDGDRGVTVDDCIFISRAIEHNLDREDQDFSLEVASAGAAAPLVNQRQYVKSVGRDLEVATHDGQYKGTLTNADEAKITLNWKAREPKPVGKGKVTVQKQADIAYEDIVEAKVMIKF
ncbi:ribosome assembly cofactor RimP [Hanstruepera neustonica]|uniref:Ribosome maturation factor RimP n=1 Tax=Hanstruepera neustonica TaxID=1445657 RepID=A0A2K1E185_9FLAO|nr:ribosome assembly cofactor RimP [Hanstruepera neustonica]PNQ74035.1 ribosome assembly cofactor RimP [Hanstruepera neustonica]